MLSTDYISQIIEEGALGFEQFAPFQGTLVGAEGEILGNRVVSKRRAEFIAGRFCARSALGAFNCVSAEVLQGPSREPIWPVGFVGSITHCDGYCAAVVAPNYRFRSLGIDAETNVRLPEETFEIIATPAEIVSLRKLPRGLIHWDRLLFSIKESTFKSWFPITNSWLDFDDVFVEICPEPRRFNVEIRKIHPFFPKRLTGQFYANEFLLLSSVFTPT
jgi:4'-phosphopantetheinyl transferase EntD